MIYPIFYVTDGAKPFLAILATAILPYQCAPLLEVDDKVKGQFALLAVFLGLGRIEFDFHLIIVYTLNAFINFLIHKPKRLLVSEYVLYPVPRTHPKAGKTNRMIAHAGQAHFRNFVSRPGATNILIAIAIEIAIGIAIGIAIEENYRKSYPFKAKSDPD